MNIYLVDAGDVMDYHYGHDYEPPEEWHSVSLIAAPTPARARYLHWKSEQGALGDLREQSWKQTKLVVRSVDEPEGKLPCTSDWWYWTCDQCWGQFCECGPADESIEEIGIIRSLTIPAAPAPLAR